jgi:periplasmic copper chaperone A
MRRSIFEHGLASALVLALSAALMPAHAADKPASSPKDKGHAAVTPQPLLVKVDAAWVRPTVKGQSATGGFMNLTASQPLTLVGFSTPSASESELHEMVMDGSVMRMRAVDALVLPAGQTVALRPGAGGQHLMLMDLKRSLSEGDEITLTLKLRSADGKILTQDVKVPVKVMTMPMNMPMKMAH